MLCKLSAKNDDLKRVARIGTFIQASFISTAACVFCGNEAACGARQAHGGPADQRHLL
jgi:hypothetical protein